MLDASNTAVAAASLFLLLQGATGPPALGGERHVLLTNAARQPIVQIYVSDNGTGNWQADLLGSDFLLPGGSVLVDIDDRDGNCTVDVRAVLDDGSERVDRRVNICRQEDSAVSLR